VIGLGLSIPEVAVRGIAVPYVPLYSQTVNFFARLATKPSNARAAAYDTLIGALVAGGVWAQLDVAYDLAGNDTPTKLTNLVSASFTATAVNSPTFTPNQGVAGNGTSSYLNTNYDPSTATNFTRNSAHIAAWNMTSRGAIGKYLCGRYSGTSEILLAPHFTGPATYCRLNEGTAAFADTVSNGFFVASRTTSTLDTGYLNGASFGTKTNATVAMVSGNIFICGSNNAGAVFLPTTDQVAFFSAGGGLTSTQVTAYYNAVHAYLQAVAGVA
jgi:hypothetical protein